MSRTRLTRRECLTLVRATAAGAVSGIARAVAAWLLERLAP
ncbi:hypothetical protein [Streptomyces virginiae]|nr:hypothetical protein OG253_41625 [Streptomyces virginiae]